MTGRVVRMYGVPRQEQIFGDRGPQLGVDEQASTPDSIAPALRDPDTDGRPHRRGFLRSAAVGAGVVALTDPVGSLRGWAQDTPRRKDRAKKKASTGVGLIEPGIEEFEAAALELIGEGEVPAAQLCVSKDGKIVFNRAYGMLDWQEGTLLPVNARFRLASLDKIITSTAVHQLIDAQAPLQPAGPPGRPARRSGRRGAPTGDRMSLDLRPFRVFEQMGIQLPPGKQTDPRLFDVTVKHLLEHSSGLSDDVHDLGALRQELGLETPPTAADAMRFHFCRELAFDPGSRSKYCSAGYWVLRFLVGLAGGSFIEYLKKNVFSPAGTANVCLSHTRPAERDPLEVRYRCVETGPSVFPEDRNEVLPMVEGGGDWNDHHLILAASAEAVVKYLSYWYFGEAWRLWRDEPGHLTPGLNNGGGVFFGGMTGIRTVMHQRRWTMCNFAFLTNWVRTRPGAEAPDFNKRLEAVCRNLGW